MKNLGLATLITAIIIAAFYGVCAAVNFILDNFGANTLGFIIVVLLIFACVCSTLEELQR